MQSNQTDLITCLQDHSAIYYHHHQSNLSGQTKLKQLKGQGTTLFRPVVKLFLYS